MFTQQLLSARQPDNSSPFPCPEGAQRTGLGHPGEGPEPPNPSRPEPLQEHPPSPGALGPAHAQTAPKGCQGCRRREEPFTSVFLHTPPLIIIRGILAAGGTRREAERSFEGGGGGGTERRPRNSVQTHFLPTRPSFCTEQVCAGAEGR